MSIHGNPPSRRLPSIVGTVILALSLACAMLAAQGCPALLPQTKKIHGDGSDGASDALRRAAESYERAATALVAHDNARQAADPTALKMVIDSIRALAKTLQDGKSVPVPTELKLDERTSERLEQTLEGIQDLVDALRKLPSGPLSVTPDKETSQLLSQVVAGLGRLADELAKSRSGEPSTVTLEPATVKQLADAIARAIPSSPQEVDLWKNPAFQTLMSTLWQAPLAILAIILAIGGFFGWQGYRELGANLSAQLAKEVEHTATLTLATGHLDAAWAAWQLALDLAKGTLSQQDVKQFTPARESKEALAHLKAAKRTARRGVSAIQEIPKEFTATVRGRSKNLLQIEAQQSLAYYLASDCEFDPTDKEDAIRYSAEAVRYLEDEEWIEREHVELHIKGPLWVDTFLFVRAVFNEDMTAARARIKGMRDSELYAGALKRFEKI